MENPMSMVMLAEEGMTAEFDDTAKRLSVGKLTRLRTEVAALLSAVHGDGGGTKTGTSSSSDEPAQSTLTTSSQQRHHVLLLSLLAHRLTDAFFAMSLPSPDAPSGQRRWLVSVDMSDSPEGLSKGPFSDPPRQTEASSSPRMSANTVGLLTEQQHSRNPPPAHRQDDLTAEFDAEMADDDGADDHDTSLSHSSGSFTNHDKRDSTQSRMLHVPLTRYDVLFYALVLHDPVASASPLMALVGDASCYRKRNHHQLCAEGGDSQKFVCWWVAGCATAMRHPLSAVLLLEDKCQLLRRWIEIGYDVWRQCPHERPSVTPKLLQLLYLLHDQRCLIEEKRRGGTEASDDKIDFNQSRRSKKGRHELRDEKIFLVSDGRRFSVNSMMREVCETLSPGLILTLWDKIRPALHNGSTTIHCRNLRGWWRYALVYSHQTMTLDIRQVAQLVLDIWSNPASEFSVYAANFLMRQEYFTTLFVSTAAQLATAFPRCPFMSVLAACAILAQERLQGEVPQLRVRLAANADSQRLSEKRRSGELLEDDEAEDDDDAVEDVPRGERCTLFDAKVLLQNALEIEPSFPFAWATLKTVLVFQQQRERRHGASPQQGPAAGSSSSFAFSSTRIGTYPDSPTALVSGRTLDAADCEEMYEQSDVPASRAFPEQYAVFGTEPECTACSAVFGKIQVLAKARRRQCRHCGHCFCDNCCAPLPGFQKHLDRICHRCFLLVSDSGPVSDDGWLGAVHSHALAEGKGYEETAVDGKREASASPVPPGHPTSPAAVVAAYRRFFPLTWSRRDSTAHAWRLFCGPVIPAAELNHL